MVDFRCWAQRWGCFPLHRWVSECEISFVNGTQRLLTQDQNDQVNWIPPAGGQVIESTFPQAGVYVGVDHNMNHVIKSAAFAVVAVNNSTAGDQPAGTWVPPKSSSFVSGEQRPAAVKMMSSPAAGAKATK
jgi:hypothetical protein